jgi:hypothetical protein
MDKSTEDKLDTIFTDPDRRRLGAGLGTIAVMILAAHIGMPMWELALVCTLMFCGLHMLSGLTLRWW